MQFKSRSFRTAYDVSVSTSDGVLGLHLKVTTDDEKVNVRESPSFCFTLVFKCRIDCVQLPMTLDLYVNS